MDFKKAKHPYSLKKQKTKNSILMQCGYSKIVRIIVLYFILSGTLQVWRTVLDWATSEIHFYLTMFTIVDNFGEFFNLIGANA